MAVIILAKPEPAFESVVLTHDDNELLKQIKQKIGNVQACKVMRFMTKCKLKTAYDHIMSLGE